MSQPNVMIRNLKAENGGLFINDTAAHIGDWDAILCTAAAVAALVSPNISGALGAVPIPAGAILYGRYTSITLASGSVVAYNRITV